MKDCVCAYSKLSGSFTSAKDVAGVILDLQDTHKTAPHWNTWTFWGGFLSVSGWVDNETDRNWMARSFELGWSESSTDAALTFHRQSPLDTVTKTSTGPHLPLSVISLWLIKLSTPVNKAPCPPPPSTPGVDGRKDDPNVDALSFNIDWIGPPAPGLNANEIARPFLTAAVEGLGPY